MFSMLALSILHTSSLFNIQAEVVCALEGGPVVVKITRLYSGEKPVSIRTGFFYSNYVVQDTPWKWAQSDWFDNGPFPHQSRWYTVFGRLYGQREMKRGEPWSEHVFLHHDYIATAGKGNVTLSWPVLIPAGNAHDPEQCQLIARPSVTLAVDVQAASQANLRELCVRLEDQIKTCKDKEIRLITQTILWSDHIEMVPIALKLLETGRIETEGQLVGYIYDLSAKNKKTPEELLVAYLEKSPLTKAHPPIFRFFQNSTYTRIPDERLKKLLLADDYWLRMLAFSSFPEKCSKESAEAILAWIESMQAGRLGEQRLAALLADLSHENYVRRESAFRALKSLSADYEPGIRHWLKGTVPTEGRRRAEQVLADLTGRFRESEIRRVISHMRSWDTQTNRMLLGRLADGPENMISTDAKTALLDLRSR